MHLAVSSFLKQNFLQVYFSNIPAKYSEVQAEPEKIPNPRFTYESQGQEWSSTLIKSV